MSAISKSRQLMVIPQKSKMEQLAEEFLKLIDENPRMSTGIGTGAGTLGGLMLGSDDEDYADDEILFEILRNVQNRGR